MFGRPSAARTSSSEVGATGLADIPGDSSTQESVSVGDSVIGALEQTGDRDWFRIDLTEGQSVTISLQGITLADPYLRIRDSAGNILYENDDSGGENTNSLLSFTATYTGTFYIDVGAWNDAYAGDYQLSVSAYVPPPLGTYDQIADQLVSGYWSGYSHSFDTARRLDHGQPQRSDRRGAGARARGAGALVRHHRRRLSRSADRRPDHVRRQ